MKKNTLSILIAVALILVFVGAAAYALDDSGHSDRGSKLACIHKDSDCNIRIPGIGTVISNSSTENSTSVTFNQSGENVTVTVTNFTDAEDEIPEYNEFLYNEINEPCYYYSINGESYCVSITNSTDPGLKTIENLEKILIISELWEDFSDDLSDGINIDLGGISLGLSLNLGSFSVGDLSLGNLDVGTVNVYLYNDSENLTIEGISIEDIKIDDFDMSKLEKIIEEYLLKDIDSNDVDLIIKDVNKLQEVNKNQNSKNIDVDITVLDATNDSLTLEYSIDNFDDGDKGILTITIDGFDYTFDVSKNKGIIKINLKKPLNEDSKLTGSFKLI